ncbi:MAG: PKD domain-containing protein [Candidatus Thermoplasmatota archaeon]|nr:PKD domain-containing protein [Candidatus Thermoplasmatota archaeon]
MRANKILLAIAIFGLLLVPAGTTGAWMEDRTPQRDDAIIAQDVESEMEVEKIEPSDVRDVIEDLRIIDIEDSPWNLASQDHEVRTGLLNADHMVPEGIEKRFQTPMLTEGQMMDTRASDDERSQSFGDFSNGSKIIPPNELISGTLDYNSLVPANSDWVDWYKLQMDDVLSAGNSPNGVHNITIKLESYSSSDPLYEFSLDTSVTPPVLGDDYADLLELYVIYYDGMNGIVWGSGAEWYYDDQDDTDGWYWDGDNAYYPDENWTMYFRTPIDSYGPEDNDGAANRLTEVGWYYIGISFNFFMSSAQNQRDSFDIDYQFRVDTSKKEDTDPIGNDYGNATVFQPLGQMKSRNRLDSSYNQIDWWSFKGVDEEKLWNMSIEINRTWTVFYANPTATQIWDNWVDILIVWWGDGEDNIWNTPDDGWTGVIVTMSLFISGGGFIDNSFSGWIINNWTGSPNREVYIGLYEQPVHMAVQSGSILGYYFPEHRVWSDYEIKLSISEVAQNIPPKIEGLEVFTKNPANVNMFSDIGGYYGTDFTVEVTYSDEDNDPPKNVWLLIDPFTAYEKKIDIVNSPKNPFATNFAEGVVYKYDVSGDLLKEGNHVILAYAMDKIPTGSIKTAYQSLNFWLNDTLIVWDDDPVMKNQNFVGAPTILEDSEPVGIPLETVNGVFIDPEGVFEGFQIWNETLGDWTDTLDLEEMTLKIEEFSGLGSVVVYPKENRHGSATIKVMGYDLYSFQNHSFKITITEVNDPPMVYYIKIGEEEYEVDNTNPLNPFAVLDSVTVLEDEEFEFQIIAEDTDHEPDRTALRYEYIRSFSGDWDEDPTVGFDSGIVTFTPTNADSQKGLLAMVFNVRDGRDNGEIRLTVSFKVTNVNDPPTITLPPSISPFYLQDQRVQFRVTGSDIDKGDVLAFSVNIESSVGDAEPVLDQLHPDADIKEGRDWGMDANTGDFWFIASDQNIWKNADGTMAKSKEIEFEFAVTDKAGAKATAKRTLIFNDVNSPPEAPKEIYHQIKDEDPDTPGDQGLTVEFWVDAVFDIELDTIQYRWTFSDGGSQTGIRINYTFATEGQKTVQVYAFDGTDESESISKVITVTKPVVDDGNGGGGGGGGSGPIETGGDDNSMLIIIIIVAAVLFILIIAVLLFFVLKKKPAPPAQVYGYDQQQLAAYQMQGLPPAQPGALPPGENMELPPAPADGDQQLGYAEGDVQPEMSAPQAQTDMAQPEEPQGMLCPSCSSPVDPTWFLCPNCKAPLQ